MADFTLTISDADVPRVTEALCGPFNFSFNTVGCFDPNTGAMVVSPEAAKGVLINLITEIVKQVAIAEAAANYVPPTMS